MNILFLFVRPIIPHMGGVQRVTHMLAGEMLRRGHNVVFLSTGYDYRIGNNENDENETIAKQYFLISKSNKDIIKKEYHSILKEEGIDIVINQMPHYDTDYLLSMTPKEIKKVSCIHIQPFNTQTYPEELLKYTKCKNWKEWLYINFCRLFPGYYKRQQRNIEIARLNKSLAVSDYLCLLSEHYIQRVLKYMPQTNEKKFIAVNNPAEVIEFDIEECKKEKTILWVGRITNNPKNIPNFIDVWNIISKKNKDWKAIIIGDGSDLQYNKDYAKRNKVERLEFAGRQQNVAQFYKKATFIGITSISEGWGMTIVESMNYGCVPFAYDTYESLHDIIEDNKNGIVVKPFNKEEMAQRIQEVIDNKDNYVAMQQNAIEKVKTFSIEKIVDKWEEIFKL